MRTRKTKLSTLHGRFWNEVYERGPGGVGVVLVEKTEPRHNDIAITEKQLMLALLANNVTVNGKGILYHAFGAGDPSWDTLGVGTIDPNATTLTDELATNVGRFAPDSIVFEDVPGGTILASYVGATAIKITTTLPFICNLNGNTFREQGLFGGTATTARNSGLMIDSFRHEPRAKSPSNQIVYFIELYF